MILRHWLDLTTHFATGTPRHRRRYAREGLAGVPVSAAHQPTIRRRVETLEDRALLAVDYGDAPDTGPGTGPGNYQTLASDNGPSHTIVAGLFLGNSVDANDGTQQSAAADIDDRFTTGGSDDEDGVLSPLDLQGTVGAQPTITLLVTNTTGSVATLSGWIDYNRNGVFDNATERAQATVSGGLTDARITLTFPTIPPGSAGQTYARFRLSTDTFASNPAGPAVNGEIEDYTFSITFPTNRTINANKSVEITHIPNRDSVVAGEDWVGSGLTTIGDLDGNGVIDLAVGAPHDSSQGTNRGAIHIVLMNSNGTVKSTSTLASGINGFPSLPDHAEAGFSIASLGDIDGDGVVDLATGTQRSSTNTGELLSGAILVLIMNSNGSVKKHSRVAHTLDLRADFGPYSSLSTVGDIDGDGVSDIAFGSNRFRSSGISNNIDYRGAAYIIMLNSDGTQKNVIKITDAANGGPVPASGEEFGRSIASLGDLDGDGTVELAITACRLDSGMKPLAEAMYVLFMNTDGTVKRYTHNLTADISGDRVVDLESIAPAGDLNGDGVQDLAAMPTYDTRGTVYLILMNSDGSPVESRKIHSNTVGATPNNFVVYSGSIAYLGDIDGDGVGDFAAGGTVRHEYVHPDTGKVSILFPRPEAARPTLSFKRQSPDAATRITSLTFRATFGESMLNVTADDFTADGGTTAIVSSIVPLSPSVYDVTLSGGDLAVFEGTVGLNLASSQNIINLSGLPLERIEPAVDETYNIDYSPPILTSYLRQIPASNSTNADQLIFRVTFNEPVVRVDASDFIVTGSTTATATDVKPISGTDRRQYAITVSGGDLSDATGTIGLKMATGVNIRDRFGNPLQPVEPAVSEAYTLTNLPPRLISIQRLDPERELTSADRLVFRVAFSELVTDVDTDDFVVDGGSTAEVVTSSAVRNGNYTEYDVSIRLGDLPGFNGSVGLNLAAGAVISDRDSPDLRVPLIEPDVDELYMLDNTTPAVMSIERDRLSDELTNKDRLVFLVSFSEPVKGVEAADFVIQGSTSASVTDIKTVSGSDRKQYRVTVSGGNLATRNGLFGLNIASNASIADLANNALPRIEPAIDQTYTLDHAAPVLTSIRRQTPSPSATSADVLVFRATFSEPITGLSAVDFAVNGTTTARVTNVTLVNGSNGTQYDVTVSGGDLPLFNGTIGLNLSASAFVTDLAGNILPRNEPATDQTYHMQNAIPDLLSIRRQTPESGSTNADQLVFRLTFDESVRKVDVADFVVNGTTTATVSNVRAVGGMNRTQYDVTVSGGNLADFNGTVGLDLAARPTIVNADGNPLPAVEPSIDEVYTLSQVNPQVVSFRRQNPLSSSTNADRLIFRVQFSEGVTGVDASDFAADGLPAARIMSVTPVDGTGLSQYDVMIAKGGLAILNGSVGLNFSSSAAIADLDSAGHAVVIAEPTIDEVYSVENVIPEAVSFRRKVPSERLTDADVLEFFVTFTEPMAGVDASDFVITGGTTAEISRVKAVENSDGRQYRITISGGDLADFNGTVGLDFSPSASITDLAGNELPILEPPLDATYLIDNVLPVAVSIQRQPAETRGSLVFRVTFNEPVTSVDVSDFVVDGTTTASVTGVSVVAASGNTQFDVTISGGNLANFNGSVGLNIAPTRVIRDIASGQSLTGMEPSVDEISVLRNGRPGAVSFSRQTPAESSTDVSTLVFRATFTETVTGVDRNDFVATGTTAGITAVDVVGGSNSTQFDVTVSGGDLGQLNSVVGLNFANSPTISDVLGNPLLNAEPAVDQTYQIEDQPADYGDAPDTGSGTGRGNYQTLETDNGPRHIIVPGLYLGAGVDASDGTTQNETADADDRFTTGGRDDEDGILDPQELRGMVFRVPTVTLLATNTTGADATLTGWIDYNQDGVFEDRYESASAVVSSGTQNGRITLTFPMIPPVLTGNTYARFRLSTDPAGAHATGEASDGEVEDYVFSITARYPYGDRTAVEISHNQNGGPLLADSDYFGTSIAPVGDLNRDGTIDLAVGAVGDDTGGGADSNRGAVHVLFMNGDGSVLSSRKIASGLNGGPVLAEQDLFGASVAPIGDLDGDGVPDLVVGSVWDDAGGEDRGAIHILRMNADGTVKNSTKIASGLNGGPVLANGDGFGYSVGSLGDLDGDGTADLAVGAYADDTGGTNRGAVHLLFMNASGSVKSSLQLASGVNGVPTLRDGDAFGSGVASLGDLDGDGIVDLAVGAYSDDSGRIDGGAVHILLLNANGSVKRGTKYLNSSIRGSFGNSLASAGDIDGDGIVNRTDLIVGAYADDTGGPGRGTFYLLNLNSDGSVHSNTRFTFGANWFPQPADEDAFGAAVAAVDLNQDGFTDFIAGAPGEDAGGADRGATHVLFQSGLTTSEVHLPPSGGSYELLMIGRDLVLRAVGGAELFRGSFQTVLGLIIHGSDQADSVRVDQSWIRSVIFNGADGHDVFDGSFASNSLTLDGGSGADTLMGGIRQDILKGGDGDDLVFGGNDHLYGLFFPNLLDGGAGNDSLIGSTAGDTLLGHAGNDLLTGNGGDDSLDGGTGNDRIEETTDGSVTIIGNQWQSASLGNNTMSDVERIVLTGGDGPNLFNAREATIEVSLIGNDGDDTLIGGSANDTLRGNRGSDVLTGGGGTDVIDGGIGFDTWFESADANFAVFGTQIVSLATGDEVGVSIERIALEGGAGNNRLNAINASVPVLLVGGAGNDTITGGTGDDTLTGGFRGDSTVAGSDGVDSLNGRDGRDTLKNDAADTRSGEVLLGDVFALLPAWLDLI